MQLLSMLVIANCSMHSTACQLPKALSSKHNVLLFPPPPPPALLNSRKARNHATVGSHQQQQHTVSAKHSATAISNNAGSSSSVNNSSSGRGSSKVNIAAATAAVSRLARARMSSAATSAAATSKSSAGVTLPPTTAEISEEVSEEGSSLDLGSIAHELAAFKQRIAKLERGSCSDSELSYTEEDNSTAVRASINDFTDQARERFSYGVCDAELSRITEMTNESNTSLCNGESNGSVCNGSSTDAAGQCNDAHNTNNSSNSSSIASTGNRNSRSGGQQQQQSVLDNSGLCDVSNDVSSDVFDFRLHTAAASASDSNPWALNSSNSGFVFDNSSSSISNISNVTTDTAQQQQQQQRNLFNTTASTNTGTAMCDDSSEQWLADHEQFTLAVLNRLSELETAMTDLSDVTATSTRSTLTVNGMSLKAIMSAAAAAAHGLSSATAVTTASSCSSTQIAGLQPVVLHLLTVAQGLAVHLVEAERALKFKEMNMQPAVNAPAASTSTTATATAAAASAVIGEAVGQHQHTLEQLHAVNASSTSNRSPGYTAQSTKIAAAAAAAAVDTVSSSSSSGGVSRSKYSSSSSGGSSGKSSAVSEHTAASSSSSYGLHCDEWSDALNSFERLLYPYTTTNTTATINTTASTTATAAAVGSTVASAVYSANKYNINNSISDISSNSVYGTPQQQQQQQQQYSSSHYSNSNSAIDSGVYTGERYAVHTVTPDRDLFVFGTATTSSNAIDTTGSDKQQQQQYSAYTDTSAHSSGGYQKNGYQSSGYSDDLYNEQHMVMLSERVSALQDRVHRVELDVDDRTTVAQRSAAAVASPTATPASAVAAATAAPGAVVMNSSSSEQQLRQLQQRQLHTHAKERSAPASVRYIPHEEGDSCIMQPKSVLLHAPYKTPDYPLRNTAAATIAATAAAATVVPDENTNSYDQQQQQQQQQQQHLKHYNTSSDHYIANGSVQQQWSAGKHSGSVSATSSSNGVKVTPDSRGHRAPLGEWYMPVSSSG
eukprot:14360-Heterococcus_DN1.PRE.5